MSYSINAHRGVQSSHFANKCKLKVYDYVNEFGTTKKILNKEIDFNFAYVGGSGLIPEGISQEIDQRDSIFSKESDAEILIRYGQAYIDLFEGQQSLDFEIAGREGIFKLVEFKRIGDQRVYLGVSLKWVEIE